jgi:hypothetical protein
MPSGAYFIRNCPTCGRSLEIRVEYLGKLLKCRHCTAEFLASENHPASQSVSDGAAHELLARAERLISSVGRTSRPGATTTSL